MNYLSVGADAKTVKGQKQGYLTGILYMAPHTLGGGRTLCPFSTAGCRAVCLYSAGRGGFNSVQQSRIRKTREFNADPELFAALLGDDIAELERKAKAQDLIPVVRLNGTTDILWEEYADLLMHRFAHITFYDYTKYPSSLRQNLPANYRLTYSYSEAKHAEKWSFEWMERGVNTAVVFSGGLPATFLQRHVIDGDLSDLRFTDPDDVIVGLKTKGKARGVVDAGTGFVQKGI